MRLAAGRGAKPGTAGILTVSGRTAVPSAIEGARLGGAGTPVLTHSSSTTSRARNAGLALCGLRGLTQGPGLGSVPGPPPCWVPAIRYTRAFGGSLASCMPVGSVCTSEAPFCQYSVEVLTSIISGSVGWPVSSEPLRPENGSAVTALPNGNQFSG